MYYVYILQDVRTGKHYTGHTDNIERRLWEHETHQSHYTARRGPYKLLYHEQHPTRSEAMKREKYLKTGVGRNEIKQIIADL